MPEPEQTAAASSMQRCWWVEMWAGARPRFVAVGTELIISVELLLALGFFYLIFRLMILGGVPAESIEFLERVDLWAIKAVFLTFSIAFVIQFLLEAYSSISGSIVSLKGKT